MKVSLYCIFAFIFIEHDGIMTVNCLHPDTKGMKSMKYGVFSMAV